MELTHGGHLTHGLDINYSGRTYDVVPYHVRRDTETIDYDEVRALALEHRPKLIICGYSSYPRIVDFAAFRAIADECGALLLADIAHIAGLIAAGVHPNPVPYCDVVTSTTHKTLTGPRAGLIMCRAEYAKAIDRAVFPGMQGGPLMHVIAAKAACLKIAQSEQFQRLQRQIARQLRRAGRRRWPTAACASSPAAPTCTSRSSTCAAPASTASSARSSSRASTSPPTATWCRSRRARSTSPAACASARRRSRTRGFMEPEMRQTGELMLRALEARGNDAALAEIRREVLDLLDRFPLYEFL